MYLFLAVAALYTIYIFRSKYLKKYRNNSDDPQENIDDGHLDEDNTDEPTEIELVEQNNDKTNDQFIEEKESWSIW